jgi:hypothetical protein
LAGLTYDALVAAVGAERYRAACAAARGTEDWPEDLAMVPHELSDAWDADDPLPLALRLYAEMPCYAHLMYLNQHYGALGGPEQAVIWETYRDALATGDRHVAYSLWVDFFEDPATVEEAWREIIRADRPHRPERLRATLPIAGPVPWPLKAVLFQELAPDPAWHAGIRDAIDASEADVHGQVDTGDAARWRALLTA